MEGSNPPRERRVGALLDAYYGIGIGQERPAKARPSTPLDSEDFDAKGHFDSIVASGQVADVVRHANEVDAEVRDLDGDMQMVVYENYSKFIRSMDVTGQVRSSVEGLEPDMKSLEGSFARIAEHQRVIEETVSVRAGEIEGLMRQRRLLKKLSVLFELPRTLQVCLERGAYGRAVEAYSSCAGFLRQHRSGALGAVLEDAERQMREVRAGLERRLLSPELPVGEAGNSAATLLDLGMGREDVERGFLEGRAASLGRCLNECFAGGAGAAEASSEKGPVGSGALGTGQVDASPDARAAAAEARLRAACAAAHARFVPELSLTLERLRRLGGDGVADTAEAFARARAEELVARLTGIVECGLPPSAALASCLEPLVAELNACAQLPAGALELALGDFVRAALQRRALEARWDLLAELRALHSRLLVAGSAEEESQQLERLMSGAALGALQGCRPLLGLAPRARGIEELVGSMLDLPLEAARAYASHGAGGEFAALADLSWNATFALALCGLLRRWEAATAPVLKAARDLGATVTVPSSEKAARDMLAHLSLVEGHRLAHLLRDRLRPRPAGAPEGPSPAAEAFAKEAHSLDTLVTRSLGDPRKQRGGHRRVFNLNKSQMELELEQMMARRLQAFAPVPLSRKGAMAGALRVAFKALYEYAREQTFSGLGLQQVQVDASFLAELAHNFVDAEDAGALGSLLAEALHSASQRCPEPAMLEPAAVEALCERQRRLLRAE